MVSSAAATGEPVEAANYNDPKQTVTSHRFRANDSVFQFVRVSVSGTRTTSRSRLSPLMRM
jgi:hypothetical protein